MADIEIKDLEMKQELDKEVMERLTGGFWWGWSQSTSMGWGYGPFGGWGYYRSRTSMGMGMGMGMGPIYSPGFVTYPGNIIY